MKQEQRNRGDRKVDLKVLASEYAPFEVLGHRPHAIVLPVNDLLAHHLQNVCRTCRGSERKATSPPASDWLDRGVINNPLPPRVESSYTRETCLIYVNRRKEAGRTAPL